MGEKDLAEKILIDYNDVFADIINVCAFEGKEIVKADSLRNTSVHSQYKALDGRLHEEERDVAKYWTEKQAAIVLYGIENQSTVDDRMPFRIIGYDGAAYCSQLLDRQKNIVPVVSFVLYFGTEKRWTKKKNIKEVLTIPKGLEDYVSDYKINVIEVAWLSDEQLKQFRSDFGIVANFFVQQRKKKDYIPDEREIRYVDAMMKLLSVMTGDNRFEKILYNENNEKVGGKTMCEAIDRWVKIGKDEGISQGLSQGINQGRSEGENAELLELPIEEVRQLISESK